MAIYEGRGVCISLLGTRPICAMFWNQWKNYFSRLLVFDVWLILYSKFLENSEFLRTWFRNSNQWYLITSCWLGGFKPKALGAWGRNERWGVWGAKPTRNGWFRGAAPFLVEKNFELYFTIFFYLILMTFFFMKKKLVLFLVFELLASRRSKKMRKKLNCLQRWPNLQGRLELIWKSFFS